MKKISKTTFCALLLAGLLLPAFVLGATIFSDNFNSYNLGNLNGQGGWSGSNLYQVQESIVKEGKAIKEIHQSGNPSVEISKISTPQANGQVAIYLRTNGGGMNMLKIRESSTGKDAIAFLIYGLKIRYNVKDIGSVILGDYVVNTWVGLKVEWRASDNKARYKIEGGDWTDWVISQTTGWTALDNIQLFGESVSGQQEFYWDYIDEYFIGETPPPPPANYVDIPDTYPASLKATIGEVFGDLTIPIVLIIVLPIAFWFISKVVATIRGSLTDKKS